MSYDVHTCGDILMDGRLIGRIDSDAEWHPIDGNQPDEETVRAAVRALWNDEDRWDERDWPAEVAQWLGVRIYTTLDRLADAYGVEPLAGSEDVACILWRTRDGAWHISAEDGWDLSDDDWAPTSDAYAREIAVGGPLKPSSLTRKELPMASKRTHARILQALELPAENAARVLTAIWRSGNRNDQEAVLNVLRAHPWIEAHTTWTMRGCLVAR